MKRDTVPSIRLLPRLNPGGERQPVPPAALFVEDKVVVEEGARRARVVSRQSGLDRFESSPDSEVEFGAGHVGYFARGQQFAVDRRVPVRVDGDAVHVQRFTT